MASSSTQNVKFRLDNFTNKIIKDFSQIRPSDKYSKNENKTEIKTETMSKNESSSSQYEDPQNLLNTDRNMEDIIERKKMIDKYKYLKNEAKKVKKKLYSDTGRRKSNNSYLSNGPGFSQVEMNSELAQGVQRKPQMLHQKPSFFE